MTRKLKLENPVNCSPCKSNFLVTTLCSILFVLALMLPNLSFAQSGRYFKNWPAGTNPDAVGRVLTHRFIATPHTNFGGPGLPGSITYPEACAWYGALIFSDAVQDTVALSALDARYKKLIDHEAKLLPRPDFVDNNVFGIVPLALYQVTGNEQDLAFGKLYADKEWTLPEKANSKQRQLAAKGYSWLTRLWIDDMYMITAVQSVAYRATGDSIYINRAAREMLYYLKELQKPNGLFFHASNAPFYWGRGNGWVAAGMTELLKSLPATHPARPQILAAFRKMMQSLKKYQSKDGMWRQLIVDDSSWKESSGTAMFTYAMIMGVKHGWLKKRAYGPVARKAWLALVARLDDKGALSDVSEGTNKNASRQFYLDRKRRTGDLHGQAPMLWCAAALMDK